MKTFITHKANTGGFNRDLHYRFELLFRNMISSQPSPSVMRARYISVSEAVHKKKDERVADEKHPLQDFTGKYKPRYITALKDPYASYLAYKPDHHTFDVETYKKDGVAKAYIFGVYSPDGVFKAYHGDDCIEKGIEYILKLKPNKSKEVVLYAHNAGNFDTYILIKGILKNKNITDIQILKDPNNSMFFLSMKYKDKTITVKDSYRIMPSSLSSLIKSLNIDVEGFSDKLPFDHTWVNENNINYKGPLPI